MSKVLLEENLLSDLDWNFDTVTKERSVHPYPARFISEIPRMLIEKLPLPKGTAVLDPFCGSGTTLIESQKIGIPSMGIDLNPIACLISKTTTNKIPNNLMKTSIRCVEQAKQNISSTANNIPHVDHWFRKDIQLALHSLKKQIFKIPDSTLQNALKVAFSSIIVRVSNQESDTRYAAIEKSLDKNDVFRFFLNSIKSLQKNLIDSTQFNTPTQIIQGNVLEIKPAQLNWKVGMVITSPPYPNAYEYWLYHKYRMWWLDFDPLKIKEFEIGARPHFFKKNPHTAETFRIQMTRLFELLSKTLVKSGYACFVIGDSKIHGKIVDNAKILEDVAMSYGMSTYCKISRNVNQNKKSFNLSYSRLKDEKIIVFKRN